MPGLASPRIPETCISVAMDGIRLIAQPGPTLPTSRLACHKLLRTERCRTQACKICKCIRSAPAGAASLSAAAPLRSNGAALHGSCSSRAVWALCQACLAKRRETTVATNIVGRLNNLAVAPGAWKPVLASTKAATDSPS